MYIDFGVMCCFLGHGRGILLWRGWYNLLMAHGVVCCLGNDGVGNIVFR